MNATLHGREPRSAQERRQSASLGLVAGALVSLAAASCGNGQSPLVPKAQADICGPPPANVEQDLSQEARAQIAGYVSAGAGGSNRQRLTQVLSQQGLMCDALAYRSCMAAYAAKASAPQMREMMQLALGACAGSGPIPSPGQPEPDVPTGPAAGRAPAGDDGDWRPGRYMAQAIERVAESAMRIEKQTAYGWDDQGACVLGAYMNVKSIINMTRQFQRGQYAVIGAGTQNVTDLDLGIERVGAGLIAKDTEKDATPVVEFVAPADGQYTMHLALEAISDDSGGAFAAIAIMKRGGVVIPNQNLISSFRRALGAAAEASALVRRKGYAGLVFHEQGDWSFYSTVFAKGEELTFNGIDLTGNLGVVLAGGDDASRDIDLLVRDTTGREVAKDDAADPSPVVLVRPEPGRSYRVTVQNRDSRGRSLVTMLVLAGEGR